MVKKDLTSNTTTSYSQDITVSAISAKRIIFEIEVLHKRLDELAKCITPPLHNSANDNQLQQIFIKKPAYSIN